jgi:KipI family sensor histidine kinase inhibitor
MVWKHAFLGESCICWSLGTGIDSRTSKRVLAAYRALKQDRTARRIGILDTVPAYASLAVYFDPARADIPALIKHVRRVLAGGGLPEPPLRWMRRILFSVRYDGEDLAEVAERAGLTERDVVDLHTRARYTVAMIGFLPHFPYLIGLDARLATPRRANPRQHVPAGSVAIGGAQAGIYPRESPGGWNLIGTTDPRRLVALRPGDTVLFREA